MRMVSGLINDMPISMPVIHLDHDVTEKNLVPAGYYITVKQYAYLAGLNESTVRSMISRGKIDSYFLDGKRVIPCKVGEKPEKF